MSKDLKVLAQFHPKSIDCKQDHSAIVFYHGHHGRGVLAGWDSLHQMGKNYRDLEYDYSVYNSMCSRIIDQWTTAWTFVVSKSKSS